jgi:type VI protein secretion system component VasK
MKMMAKTTMHHTQTAQLGTVGELRSESPSAMEMLVARAASRADEAAEIEKALTDLLDRLDGSMPERLNQACGEHALAAGLLGKGHQAMDDLGERLQGCAAIVSQLRSLI